MKLIDKDALVAEITQKIKVLEAFIKNFDGISDKVEKAKNKIEALGDVLLFIDTLEVKEVDYAPECMIFPRPIECYSTCKECPWLATNKAQKGE